MNVFVCKSYTGQHQAGYAVCVPVAPPQEYVKEKQATHTHDKNTTTHDHTKESNPPPPPVSDQIYDTDKDGKLSKEELTDALKA